MVILIFSLLFLPYWSQNIKHTMYLLLIRVCYFENLILPGIQINDKFSIRYRRKLVQKKTNLMKILVKNRKRMIITMMIVRKLIKQLQVLSALNHLKKQGVDHQNKVVL